MRLSRKFKWGVRALVLFALVALAAGGVWIGSGGPARLLSRQLSRVLGSPLTVEQIQLPGLRHAAVENVVLLLPDGRPFLFMERVDLHFSYSGLLLGRLGQAQVSGWELLLFLDEHGRPAFPPLATGGGAMPKLEIALLRGQLEIDNASGVALASYDVPGIDIRMDARGVSVHTSPPLAPRLFTQLSLFAAADGSARVHASQLRPDLALAEAARMGWTPPVPVACDGPLDASLEMPAGGAASLELAGPTARVRIALASTPVVLVAPRLSVTQDANTAFTGTLDYDALTVGSLTLPRLPHGLAWNATIATSSATGLSLFADGGGPELPFSLEAVRSADGKRLIVNASLHVNGQALTWPGGGLSAPRLSVSGGVNLDGDAAKVALQASGELQLTYGPASLHLRNLEFALSSSADMARMNPTWQARLQADDLLLSASDASMRWLEPQAVVQGDWHNGTLTLRGNLSGEALESRMAALAATGRLAAPAAGFAFSLASGHADWDLSGNGKNLLVEQPALTADAGRIAFTSRGKGNLDPLAGTVHAALQIDAATATALEGRFLGQDLCFGVSLEAASSADRLATVATVSATAGQVLYDTLYASLSEFPIRLESALESSPATAGEARPGLVHLELPGLVVEASGPLAAAAWRPQGMVGVDARIELAKLLPLLQPALAPALPSLAEATASGAVHLAARVRTDSPAAVGTLQLSHVDALLPKLFGLLATGVDLRLPFSLALAATEELPEAPPGALTCDSLALPGLVLDKLALTPQLSRNRLALTAPLRIQQYGGLLELKRLAWEDVLCADSAFVAEGNLEHLDLGQASAAGGRSLFEGKLDCPDFGIRKEGRRFFLSRPLRLEAFGGEVICSDLSLEDPGSPYMDLRTSVEIQHLDLGRLTSVIPVGRITGILEGYARDVILVGGEEMAFDVDLHTVPTKGVPQEISAKAIKNLLVGTEIKVAASFSSTLSQYSYSKLGLKAALGQGILRLQGTQKADEGQFFMVGAGMNKLNIVLHGVEGGIDYRKFRASLLAQIRGVDLNKMPDIQVK